MPRYIDADSLYGRLYPLDTIDKRTYQINAKAVADAIAKTPTADVAPKSEAIKEYLAKVLEKKDIAGHFSPGHAVVSVSVLEYFAKEFTEGKRDV